LLTDLHAAFKPCLATVRRQWLRLRERKPYNLLSGLACSPQKKSGLPTPYEVGVPGAHTDCIHLRPSRPPLISPSFRLNSDRSSVNACEAPTAAISLHSAEFKALAFVIIS
jgi:hypothetical protein